MKMTKRLLSILLSLALMLSLVPAFSMTALAADNVSTYTLQIPSTLTVSAAGWNETSGLTASVTSGDSFDNGKKLTVTAASANSWSLKSGDNSVGYNLATATGTYSSTATPASWEFTAAELNASGGTNKAMGIIVDDYSTKPAGTYQDTVTFTASVEDAAPAQNIVDLSTLTDAYEAQDGDVLINALSGDYKITIADGATVTLKDVTITCLTSNAAFAGITPLGDATILLEGTNVVKGGFVDYGGGYIYADFPGIFAPEGYTLTIDGTGSLTASNGDNNGGGGIGGEFGKNAGNIEIKGGNITAIGGFAAAGIGGGNEGNCGDITITGGTVNATGGTCAAGIGGGGNSGSCGNIRITDTVTQVTATAGTDAASIGAGAGGSCGTVTIGGVEGAITQSPYTYEPN